MGGLVFYTKLHRGGGTQSSTEEQSLGGADLEVAQSSTQPAYHDNIFELLYAVLSDKATSMVEWASK